MVKCLFWLSCKVGEMSFTPFLSGFCHFGLVSFMGFVTEPWHSRHVLFSCLVFRFHVGVRTLTLHVQSHCVSVQSRVGSAACVLWCCTQFMFLLAACIHVMSCAVWHAACVFHWLRAFMLSCLVWTRGLWVFSLAACSCPVLHMAGDLFAGHVLVFLFCVSTWFLS